MPFTIQPSEDCASCPYGKCVSYIREQSKRMKDRDTQYRLAQKISMACTYDNEIPGFDTHELGNKKLSELVNQCIFNGVAAGKYIEEQIPTHFGSSVEQAFSLTSGQVAKVRGDVFETLARVILWNASLCLSNRYPGKLPETTRSMFLDTMASDQKEPAPYAAITLGDNYDLKQLFHSEAREKFTAFEQSLNERGTSFCYSTPDVIVIRCRSQEIWRHFSEPITSLSIHNQDVLSSSRLAVEGMLDPSDIILAAGIKTSIRSDRMYQLLFEANAWKAIWRSIYGTEPSKYYSIIGQSYGADPRKLNSIEFTSLGKDLNSVSKAIDGLVRVLTPFDLLHWYSKAVV